MGGCRGPRVSVLLPVRDAAATLEPCLRSLRRQSLADWECLVVDDGSADGSLALARRLAGTDRRVAVVEAGPVGLVGALEAGLERCRGTYLARMDADDLCHRRRLELQARTLDRDAGLAGVGCHVRLFPRRRIGPGDRAYEIWINSMRTPDDVRRDAFVECPLVHPTWMFRREAIADLGYRDAGWPEDYDLLLRSLRAGHRLGVVPRRLLGWRQGPHRLSRRSARYDDRAFTACKAHHLARSFLADHDRFLLWGYGATGRRLAAELARHGRQVAGLIELHPGRLGNRIRGVEAVPPEAIDRLPRLPLIVSVAGDGPRGRIRAFLERRGRVDGRDYVCAA